MAHNPGSRPVWLWIVVLAGLAALGQPSQVDNPLREDGEVQEESSHTIVGSWQKVQDKEKEILVQVRVTFDADGRVTVDVSFMGEKEQQSGSYTVDGSTLTTRITAANGKKLKAQKEETVTIKTLDDTKLITDSPREGELEYQRVK
jgi:uncharacterized protein (TIGR03066 family)